MEFLLIFSFHVHFSQQSGKSQKLLLISGGVDNDKIDAFIKGKSIGFVNYIDKIKRNIDIALEILKSADPEIAMGRKGQDVNIFIIKSCEILQYYFSSIGNMYECNHYKSIYDNCKKYFVVR